MMRSFHHIFFALLNRIHDFVKYYFNRVIVIYL